jgi:acyl dehydratase
MAGLDLDRYLKTEKQKSFEYDFCKDAEIYEVWDEIVIGEEYDSTRAFEIKKEDMTSYAESVLDDNPLYHDEEFAAKSHFGRLIPHPLFLVLIAFYCIDKGKCSWIRSPGAMNPGQRIAMHEPFKVGEIISVKQKSYDKWIKRNKHFVTYQLDYYNQKGTLKGTWWITLILPPTREELLKHADLGR